jgi:hypothetical protein
LRIGLGAGSGTAGLAKIGRVDVPLSTTGIGSAPGFERGAGRGTERGGALMAAGAGGGALIFAGAGGGALIFAGDGGEGASPWKTRASAFPHCAHVAAPMGAYRSQRPHTMPTSEFIRGAGA